MSITGAEGIENGCISVEQLALLSRQSATAKVGNELRKNSSVSEVPRMKRPTNNWTKGVNRKLWECYL